LFGSDQKGEGVDPVLTRNHGEIHQLGLAACWEADRLDFENCLRDQERVPAFAVTVSVSLDGVLVPMKDGRSKEKRAATRAKGVLAKEPAGYNETSCGTLTFHDALGVTLETRRLARMPESGKVTLKARLALELAHVLARRPDLRVVTIADGANDNWTFLCGLPAGRAGYQIVDFFHAAGHLADAMVAEHGEGTVKFNLEFEKYRHILRHETDGVEKVTRHLGPRGFASPQHRRHRLTPPAMTCQNESYTETSGQGRALQGQRGGGGGAGTISNCTGTIPARSMSIWRAAACDRSMIFLRPAQRSLMRTTTPRRTPSVRTTWT
jgi:hypothetical protein